MRNFKSSINSRNDKFARLIKQLLDIVAAFEDKPLEKGVYVDLEDNLELSPETIKNYKKGNVPNYEKVVRLARYFSEISRTFNERDFLRKFLEAAGLEEWVINGLFVDLYPETSLGESYFIPPNNLPKAVYPKFIGREDAYTATKNGLMSESNIVIITGMPGVGKKILALRIAKDCLHGLNETPQFKGGVIWVNEKASGKLFQKEPVNLSTVIDQIAGTLVPDIRDINDPQKTMIEIADILKRDQVLLVINNLETITDQKLLTWLLKLPEPTKVLITTENISDAFREAKIVRLRGLGQKEAFDFIEEELRRQNLSEVYSPMQFTDLIEASGGNPKIIQTIIGFVHNGDLNLTEAVEKLNTNQIADMESLFQNAVLSLTGADSQMLMALEICPYSTSKQALMAISGLNQNHLDKAIQHLKDVNFLKIKYPKDPKISVRYELDRSVQPIARKMLSEHPNFNSQARRSWIEFYIELVSKVGWCWDDMTKLDLIEPEQKSISDAISWCFDNGFYVETIKLVNGVFYYYNVRGTDDWHLWTNAHQLALSAAQKLEDYEDEQVWQHSHYIEALTFRGKLEQAGEELKKLEAYVQTHEACLSSDKIYHTRIIKAFHLMEQEEPNLLSDAKQILEDIYLSNARISKPIFVIARQWLATCYYRMGLDAEARHLFEEQYKDDHNFRRCKVYAKFHIARLDIRAGNFKDIRQLLDECLVDAEKNKDYRYIALSQLSLGIYFFNTEDILQARQALEKAREFFARLGYHLRKELEEAEQKLNELTSLLSFKAES